MPDEPTISLSTGLDMLTLINKLTSLEQDAIKLAEKVIEASLYWTGDDEERTPVLKTARTLAGILLAQAYALGDYGEEE